MSSGSEASPPAPLGAVGALDGPSGSSGAEGRPLLQRRVAAFAGAFGLTALVSLTLRAAMRIAVGDEGFPIPPSTLWLQAGATASLAGVWLLLAGPPRSSRFVRAVEAVGFLVTGACLQLMALILTLELVEDSALHGLARDRDTRMFAWFAIIFPLVGVSFILTYAMVLRAAFVPTAARHTAALTAMVGLPLVGLSYAAGIGTSEMNLAMFSTPALALGGGLQWAFTVLVSTVVSKVIWGLREEVREARRLGQYTLQGLIGEGGMGLVYRASHAMLRRPTAIKLLPPERAGREALERFEREVQLTAQLTHPNTVTVYDYGRTADGVLYYAMELLDGATLEEIVQVDGPQPPARVVRILEQVAGALGEAHAIGLIHRDVKPANIVLSHQGGELDVAKVLDFGLVKELEERAGAAVSQEGTISGTPLYMAPELLTEAESASPRSDIYAVGAVGYYLLTGTHLFEGETVIEVLGHHLHTEPEPPSQRLGDEVPPDLERLILDCVEKDPSERPADASELRRRLESCDVGRWKQRSAELWWNAHGPALASLRACRAGGAGDGPRPTVTVDVVRRG